MTQWDPNRPKPSQFGANTNGINSDKQQSSNSASEGLVPNSPTPSDSAPAKPQLTPEAIYKHFEMAAFGGKMDLMQSRISASIDAFTKQHPPESVDQFLGQAAKSLENTPEAQITHMLNNAEFASLLYADTHFKTVIQPNG